MTTGWHYTTASLWGSIQKTGLVPYPLTAPGLSWAPPGIWCWPERLCGESEVGTVLFQACSKSEPNIVLLQFVHDDADLLSLDLTHRGQIGNWVYHERQTAKIVVAGVPPQDIRLVKEFDLLTLIGSVTPLVRPV